MTPKLDKVMQNLQDSLDTSITIEDVDWCQVKKNELEALIECANRLELISNDEGWKSSALKKLEQCADE